MLELYHWEPNANSGKPMLALAEKGVAYESRYRDLLRLEQHSPEYLLINPEGTLPALVHDGRVLTDSTPMMEYIDEVFPGPPLRPQCPRGRWQMRWWLRFFDSYAGPSISMIGWSVFVGPALRTRDPEELNAAIERIPLPARKVAWRKAMFNEFSADELAESQRRVRFVIGALEEHLASHAWIAGEGYSLGDIAGFNLAFGLPLSQPAACNDEQTPHLLGWLRRIYARPAVRLTMATGRTALIERVKFLERR
jgi:glutathione S-transferase/GST-like protein